MAATDDSRKRRRAAPRRPKGQAPKDNQLHPTFTDFQRWVIDKLVGVYTVPIVTVNCLRQSRHFQTPLRTGARRAFLGL